MAEGPPIYVGYLGLPTRHRRFVLVASVVLVGAFVVGAGVIAAVHREPGEAIWDTGRERTWRGVVRMEPYPMLVEEDGTASFIVGMGKFAVHDLVEPFDGTVCEVRGFSLARAHRRMIELTLGDDPIVVVGGAAPPPLSASAGRKGARVSVVGEIVDGKCYLGAMKPGDGKGHKSCAVLCIEGGLPPLVAAEVSDMGRLYPLLRVGGSTELPAEVLELVAEPVRIEGELSEVGGLPVLDVADASAITRTGRP